MCAAAQKSCHRGALTAHAGVKNRHKLRRHNCNTHDNFTGMKGAQPESDQLGAFECCYLRWTGPGGELSETASSEVRAHVAET